MTKRDSKGRFMAAQKTTKKAAVAKVETDKPAKKASAKKTAAAKKTSK